VSPLIADLAQRLAPSIVGLPSGRRGGSGVVVAPGVAVTLSRNVDGEEVSLRTSDGSTLAARVAGRDPTVDLAVLTFDQGADLPAAAWAQHAAPLRIGSPVYALADPGGRGLRATSGAVSSAPHAVRGPTGRLIEAAIEHTAPLPRGSGGGPLVDEHGAILGLNALRYGEGLLLAWPATALRDRAGALATGRSTAPPRLGVALAGPRQTRRLRAAVGLPPADGLLVRDVEHASPAADAGVGRGDVLVAASGVALTDVDALYTALDAGRAAPIPMQVLRGTDTLELTIVLGEDA
jgi:serine protease Do